MILAFLKKGERKEKEEEKEEEKERKEGQSMLFLGAGTINYSTDL